MEKKIKLPRKRKKRYIKELGSLSYMSVRIVFEVLYEEDKTISRRFENLSVVNNKIVVNYSY